MCRATSAAPALFPPARIESVDRKNRRVCVDGGVIANNPALAAVHHVMANTVRPHCPFRPESGLVAGLCLAFPAPVAALQFFALPQLVAAAASQISSFCPFEATLMPMLAVVPTSPLSPAALCALACRPHCPEWPCV